MKKTILAVGAAAALSGFIALPALAQSSTGSGTGFQMPYQSGFWGYAGIGGGVSESKNCPTGGCDKRDDAWKAYVGGNFNRTFGGEISYVNLGKLTYGSGSDRADGINLSLMAGLPIGTSSSVFAKVGSIYGETRSSGTTPFSGGTDRDWGLSYGLGGTVGFSEHWAGRLDWDRYRLKYADTGSNDVDALMLSVQYRFH